MCYNQAKTLYSCEIWVRSTNIKFLYQALQLLPISYIFKKLDLSVKRFTLLRSPLGNKKFKDQYEHREYGVYVRVRTDNAYTLLSFLESLHLFAGVKSKILVSRLYK